MQVFYISKVSRAVAGFFVTREGVGGIIVTAEGTSLVEGGGLYPPP